MRKKKKIEESDDIIEPDLIPIVEEEDFLIPEMEFLTDKEKEKMKRKGINLEDFPDDPRKYIDDISEDTKE